MAKALIDFGLNKLIENLGEQALFSALINNGGDRMFYLIGWLIALTMVPKILIICLAKNIIALYKPFNAKKVRFLSPSSFY